ncbi:DUF6318 family protein [Thermasporomyces composti]|uniref:DUF6318 family protein n=1 Tax=Thermasporomyces composti TaxID=696763 RepID=UPI000E245050|nr:DUF6318 family protein [Thermasporomyces composti]
MSRIRPVVRAVLVGAVAVAALTACDGGAVEPTALEEPQTSPVATSTPTPTEAATPSASPTGATVITSSPGEEVDPATAVEVKAFISDYLRAQNEATRTGDFSTVDTMVTDTCQVCAASKQYITRAYQSGGKVEGGVFSNPTVTVGTRRGDRILVTVKAVVTAYTTTDGSGKVVDQGPAAEETYQYEVSQVDGRWRIVGGSFVG